MQPVKQRKLEQTVEYQYFNSHAYEIDQVSLIITSLESRSWRVTYHLAALISAEHVVGNGRFLRRLRHRRILIDNELTIRHNRRAILLPWIAARPFRWRSSQYHLYFSWIPDFPPSFSGLALRLNIWIWNGNLGRDSERQEELHFNK